jgi:hypothetical protein
MSNLEPEEEINNNPESGVTGGNTSSSSQRLQSLAYNILNHLGDDLVKDKEIPELESCSECTMNILSSPIKELTILSCEHIFHRSCIEKQLLYTKPGTCPFPDCGKNAVNIEDPNSTRRRSNDSSAENTSRKKAKSSGRDNSPILKRLIQELSTDTSEGEISLQTDSSSASSTNAPIDFLKLYKDILDAEDASKKTAQDLILRYFHFGKALKDRYNFFRKTNPKRTSQGLVNNEARKQIPESVSESLLRKTKERAQKIYDMFSELGIDKIKRIKTFTVSTLTHISQEDIDYVLAMLSSS